MLVYLNAHPELLALVIFCARICDVSLGTVRTIMVFRGYRLLSAAIGFVEVLIWIMAAGKVLTNLNQWYLAVAYAAGFATGNIIGIWLEEKLAIGNAVVRAVSPNVKIHLANRLRKYNYQITEVMGKGQHSLPVEILFLVEKRRNLPQLLQRIKEIDPSAFCTIEDIRGFHPATDNGDSASSNKRWRKTVVSKRK